MTVGLVLEGLAAISLLVLLTALHLWYWKRRLLSPADYAVVDEIMTADGARIELRQVPIPSDAPRSRMPPVLLVHGLGANHRNQDLAPRCSLARHLAARGRSVWLVTLRCALRQQRGNRPAREAFSAMVKHDLPSAIDGVLVRTGAKHLDYIGYSMGGMLLYGALGRTVPPSKLRRAVLVAAPGRIWAPSGILGAALRWIPLSFVPRWPARLGAHAIAFASEWLKTPIHRALLNPSNVERGLVRAMLVNAVEDIPATLNAELVTIARLGGQLRVNGEPVLQSLANVDIPALFFAGTADRVAPMAAVEQAFDAWGSAHPEVEKRFVVLGLAHGSGADYGHTDLAIGIHADVELFEPIAEFLSATSATRVGADIVDEKTTAGDQGHVP